MKRLSTDELQELASRMTKQIEQDIEALQLSGIEFRRDFDGVSQDGYLLAKLISEQLAHGKMNLQGLVCCTEDETMTDIEFKQGALDAGIPLSVIEGKTKLSNHFSKDYIDWKRGKTTKAKGGA